MHCKRHELLRLVHHLEATYSGSGVPVGKRRDVPEESERRTELNAFDAESVNWIIELSDAVASVTDLGADKVQRGIVVAHRSGCRSGLASVEDREGWLAIVQADDTRATEADVLAAEGSA